MRKSWLAVAAGAVRYLAVGVRASVSPAIAFRDAEVCSVNNLVVLIYVSEQTIEYPVYINTFIESNTVLVVDEIVSISVDNAPTQLVSNIVVTSTVTITSSTKT